MDASWAPPSRAATGRGSAIALHRRGRASRQDAPAGRAPPDPPDRGRSIADRLILRDEAGNGAGPSVSSSNAARNGRAVARLVARAKGSRVRRASCRNRTSG
ncbi:hypothetical protein Maq22A_c28825 [Methylobacterium aquaticum]|uniref:Uncharacterized protein n=1 Tax=Methylobacterium aquaticum TaxID=270351 RepID=A0A1Y0ZCB4_9HYPH|nr:hypothetical protein Maq22A_c28825 [Methylobacterium aquaticum]